MPNIIVIAILVLIASPLVGQTLGTSAASPSPASSFGATTGLFSSTAGAVSVSSAGTEVMRVISTGVGIGTSSPNGPLNVVTTTSSSGIRIDVYNNSANASFGFRAARGTVASPTALQADDAMGTMGGRGYGATGFSSSNRSAIKFLASENWSDSAQGAYIQFITTPNGTTSQAETMRLDPSGNLGVGTTNPGARLDVKGTLWLSGSTSGHVGLAPASAAGSTTYTLPAADGSNGQLLTTNGSGVLSWTTDSGAGPWTVSGTNIYYSNGTSGNVGIRTSTPTAMLDVNGHIRASGWVQPSTGAGIEISYDPSTDIGYIQSVKRTGSNGLKPLYLNAKPLLVNADDGDQVAIGTGTPSSALVTIHKPSGTALFVDGRASVGLGTTTGNGYLQVYANQPDLLWVTRAASSGFNAAAIKLAAMNASNQVKEFASVEGLSQTVTAGSETGALLFYTTNSGSPGERVRITASGSVAIGTATPRGGSTLDVNGTVYVGSFETASSTAVCQNGNVLSNCSSARRFKENIKRSNLGLQDVLAMKPVTFDFIDHKESWEKHDFGFVAEDMQKINNLFVTYDNDGKLMGVRYMQLAAVTVKAIQELTSQLTEQKALIARQQNEIDQMKKQIGSR